MNFHGSSPSVCGILWCRWIQPLQENITSTILGLLYKNTVQLLCVCVGNSLFFSFIFISWRLITLQYCSGFCHTLTWISCGFTCIPHPDPPSHLPLHPIPLGLSSAPGPSIETCILPRVKQYSFLKRSFRFTAKLRVRYTGFPIYFLPPPPIHTTPTSNTPHQMVHVWQLTALTHNYPKFAVYIRMYSRYSTFYGFEQTWPVPIITSYRALSLPYISPVSP